MQRNDFSDFEDPLKKTKENHNYTVRQMIKLKVSDLSRTEGLEENDLKQLKEKIRANTPSELNESSLKMFTKSHSSLILYKQINDTYVKIKQEASSDKRRTYLHQVFSIMHPWVRGLHSGATNTQETDVNMQDAGPSTLEDLGIGSESGDGSKEPGYNFSDANKTGIFGYLSRENIPECCKEVVKNDENFVRVPTEITLDTKNSKQHLFFDTKLSREDHFLELYCTYADLLVSTEQNHGIEERDVKTKNVLFLNRDHEICSHVEMEEINIHCWFTPDPVVDFIPRTVEMEVDSPPLKTYGFPETSVLSTVPVKTAIKAIDDYDKFLCLSRLQERGIAATPWFSSTAIRRRIEYPLDKTPFSVFETTAVAAAAIESKVGNDTYIGTRHMALAAKIMQSTSLDIFKNHFDVPPFVFVDNLGLQKFTELKSGGGCLAQNCIKAVKRCNEYLRSLFKEETKIQNCIKAVERCTKDPDHAASFKGENDTHVISLCLESYSKNAYLHAVKEMSSYHFLSKDHDLKSPLKTRSCFLCIPERGNENSNALISTWVHRDRKATEETSKGKKYPAEFMQASLESAYKTAIMEKTKSALNKLIHTKYDRWIQEIKEEGGAWVDKMDDVFKTNYSNERHHPWTIHGVYLLCLCSGFMLKAACLATLVDADNNYNATALHYIAISLHNDALRVAEQTLQRLDPNDTNEKAIRDPIDLVFFYNNNSNAFPSIDESYRKFPDCPTKGDSEQTRDDCLEFSRKLCTFAYTYINEQDDANKVKPRFFLGAFSTKDHSKEDTFHAPYFEKTLRENLFEAYNNVVASADFSDSTQISTKIAATFLASLSSLALEKNTNAGVAVIEDTPQDPACAKVAALLTWIEFSREGSVDDLLRYKNTKFNSRDVREKRGVPKFMMGAVNAMHLVPPADRTDAIYEFTVGVDADDAGQRRESVLYTTEKKESVEVDADDAGQRRESVLYTTEKKESAQTLDILKHVKNTLGIKKSVAHDEGNDELVDVLVASALMKADGYLNRRKTSLQKSWSILKRKKCQYTPMSLVIQKLISKVYEAIQFLTRCKENFAVSRTRDPSDAAINDYYTTKTKETFDTRIFGFGWLDYLKCEEITNEIEALEAQDNYTVDYFLYSSPRSSLNTAEIVLDSISEWGKCILPVQINKRVLTIPSILQNSKALFLKKREIVELAPVHLTGLIFQPLSTRDYKSILTNYFPLFLIFAYATENDPSLELLGYKGFLSYVRSGKIESAAVESTPLVQMQKLVLVLPPTLKPLIPFW